MASKRRRPALDRYPWTTEDPDADLHALIDPVLSELHALRKDDLRKRASDTASWAALQALSLDDAGRAIGAAFQRMAALIQAQEAWEDETGTEAYLAPQQVLEAWLPGINTNAAVITALLARPVLLPEPLLFGLVVWAIRLAAGNAAGPFLPLAAAVERCRAIDGLSERVHRALESLRECLLGWNVRNKKLYAGLDALIARGPEAAPPMPVAPVGLEVALAAEADELLSELAAGIGRYDSTFESIQKLPSTKAALAGSPALQLALVRNVMRRLAAHRDRLAPPREGVDGAYANLPHTRDYPRAETLLLARLLRRKLPFTAEDLAECAEWAARLERLSTFYQPHWALWATVCERHAAVHGLTARQRVAYVALARCFEWIEKAPERTLMGRFLGLARGSTELPLDPGEAWSEAAIADVGVLDGSARERWRALLEHCGAAAGGAPSARWLAGARDRVSALGFAAMRSQLLRWFPKVAEPRPHDPVDPPDWRGQMAYRLGDRNETVLKGLAWCCSLEGDAELARALGALAATAYRKLPGIGPRAVKLGNACLTALGQMPHESTVGQLAILKARVKFRTAHKLIDRALAEAAERVGVSRSEIEEIGLPTHGLTAVGHRREELGDYAADLVVTGTGTTELRFTKTGASKALKAVPKAVKDRHPEALAELRSAAKDIQKLLPAQRQRIDGLFLQQREWTVSAWRDRYLDHPLVGYLGRRIIWRFTAGDSHVDAVWHDGGLIDVAGERFAPPAQATVTLWHPIGEPVATVLAWRELLESRGIVQPFKQAYREIYVLTDAERATASYSNRYAAHIIRQHQFNALCAARGWRNTLQLLVDDEFPPAHRELPAWGIRAEFWCDGAGDQYDIDTNETGVFHRLATDQVRFFPLAAPVSDGSHGFSGRDAQGRAEPLPLTEVPPLVFSEIMRDVDLFVGVASVGNDPAWSDGGPDGRHRDYWERYSFGELSATAATRKAVLERLVPRLKIADRCQVDGRFLRVRGDLRTYKIHLGSGNILMEPNDQYLCIVKGRSTGKGSETVMLPFEGDGTLSLILSKAFLLASDTEINDATILSQIRL